MLKDISYFSLWKVPFSKRKERYRMDMRVTNWKKAHVGMRNHLICGANPGCVLVFVLVFVFVSEAALDTKLDIETSTKSALYIA